MFDYGSLRFGFQINYEAPNKPSYMSGAILTLREKKYLLQKILWIVSTLSSIENKDTPFFVSKKGKLNQKEIKIDFYSPKTEDVVKSDEFMAGINSFFWKNF